MKQGEELVREKDVQEDEDKIAKMLTKLSKQQFLDLQRQVALCTNQRLDSILLIIRRESRIRQILNIKCSDLRTWKFEHILELTKQIQEINDERTNRKGKFYFAELRYLILVKQLQKQRQLSWKGWFSLFKRSSKQEERLNELQRELLTNWEHQYVKKQMQSKSTNHYKPSARTSK